MTKEGTIETTRKWLEAHDWAQTGQGEWMKSIRSLKSAGSALARVYCDGEQWQLVITYDEHILFNDKLDTNGPLGYGIVAVLVDRAMNAMAMTGTKMYLWANGDISILEGNDEQK